MEETNMNKKKLLALLMALVMTLTLVPVTALAEEATSDYQVYHSGDAVPDTIRANLHYVTDYPCNTVDEMWNRLKNATQVCYTYYDNGSFTTCGSPFANASFDTLYAFSSDLIGSDCYDVAIGFDKDVKQGSVAFVFPAHRYSSGWEIMREIARITNPKDSTGNMTAVSALECEYMLLLHSKLTDIPNFSFDHFFTNGYLFPFSFVNLSEENEGTNIIVSLVKSPDDSFSSPTVVSTFKVPLGTAKGILNPSKPANTDPSVIIKDTPYYYYSEGFSENGLTIDESSGGTLIQTTAGPHYAPKSYVAQVVRNDTVIGSYETLEAAVEDANAGDTIKLLDDSVSETRISVSKTLTIDGQDHKISVKDKKDDRVIDVSSTNGVTLTLKDVTIDANECTPSYTRGISMYGNTNIKLVLDGVSIDCPYYAINVAGANNGVTVEVKNSSVAAGWAGINVWSPSTITVTDSTISGTNDKTYNADGWNNFSTVVMNRDDSNSTSGSTLTFTNCDITAKTQTGNAQWLVDLRDGGITATFDGCRFAQSGTTSGGKCPDALFAFSGDAFENVTLTDCTITKDGNQVDIDGLLDGIRFHSEPALFSTYVIDNVQYAVGTDYEIYRAIPGTVQRTNDYYFNAGTFADKPDAVAIADGYAAMANDNAAYPYKVAKMTASVNDNDVDVTVDQKSEIVASSDAYTAATSSLGTAAAVTVSGVVLTADKTVTVGDVSKSGIQAVVDKAAENESFSQKLEDADRVEIEVNVKVKPETYVVQEQTKTATFDLTPYATVKTFDGNSGEATATSGEIKVSNDMIDQSQPILVKLYTNFEPQLLLHVGENFSETITKGTYPSLEEFSYENGYCYLYINHFSDIHALYSTSSVASIGAIYYDTLAAAFAAATDGDTINVLKDSSGAGIIAAQDKFPTGLTVNFNGHTYTVENDPLAGSAGTKTQAFQLLKGNKITFTNGAIVGNNANVKMLIQNYADLTLDKMVLDATQGNNNVGYVLSTNNGNTVINDTTIKAKTNGIAFDVDSGWGNYASNSVEVTGNSVITGNVEVAFEGKTAGTPSVLTLTSGTLNGNIVAGKGFASTTVTKEIEFTNAVPESYVWADNGDGTSTLRRKAEVNFEGGSLRKRRIIGTEDMIVYNETDLRFGFTVYLPKGAVIDNDQSCFTWYKGDDSTNSRTVKMKKVQDIDDVTHVSNLVLNKVTSANFDTELHCMLKVVYTMNNTEYTIYSANEDPNAASDNYWNTRSVRTVANGLSGDWAAYAEQLQYVQ